MNAIAIGLVFVILPLWLVLHYRTRLRQSKVLTADNERSLGDLSEVADRLEMRLTNLERLLDAAVPDWRKRS